MFVVLGASGNTGKVVAETLLRQKKKVRVVLHDAAKGKAWGEAGADVAIADVDEGAALERAFSGAEGVYVLLPPNFSSSHVRVDNNRRTNTIAAAVEAAGVPHVVLLSAASVSATFKPGEAPWKRRADSAFGQVPASGLTWTLRVGIGTDRVQTSEPSTPSSKVAPIRDVHNFLGRTTRFGSNRR